jgi:CRP-like cAMP-binding protein
VVSKIIWAASPLAREEDRTFCHQAPAGDPADPAVGRREMADRSVPFVSLVVRRSAMETAELEVPVGSSPAGPSPKMASDMHRIWERPLWRDREWASVRSFTSVDKALGYFVELYIQVLGGLPQYVERLVGGHAFSFHEDALGLSDQFPRQ